MAGPHGLFLLLAGRLGLLGLRVGGLGGVLGGGRLSLRLMLRRRLGLLLVLLSRGLSLGGLLLVLLSGGLGLLRLLLVRGLSLTSGLFAGVVGGVRLGVLLRLSLRLHLLLMLRLV